MRMIPFYDTSVTGSFWGKRQQVVKDVTIDAVYDRFLETKRFEAVKCDKEQQEREGWHSHIFWDSDIAKWIEGVAYVLEKHRDERLEGMIDRIVDDMCDHQFPDGYYNCYYNIYDTDKRFTVRGNHELYCLGHLIEGAVAYFHATGKDKMLNMVRRYADLVIKVFQKDQSAAFVTPGHEEIELALVKLYHATGERKYLELSKFFIDERGRNEKDPKHYFSWGTEYYSQDQLPVREQTTAEGHSVRAMYLFIAMADLAREYGDDTLLEACRKLFGNVSEKRMYITGGIGSSGLGEAFTVDYDLPNEKAYTETCATLALALFCRRLTGIEPKGAYGDIAEIAMYNGSISGVSLDGDTFFYENPLAVDLKNRNKNPATRDKERYPITQRVKMFGCSCCPPNILRFITSIADFLYTDDGDTLFVNHYMNSETSFEGKTIRQTTDYPSDGKVRIEAGGYKTVAVRVPFWCDSFTASAEYVMKDGYAYFRNAGNIEIDFNMRARFVSASPRVHENAGKIALMYGPLTYCIEGIDNEGDLFAMSADPDSKFGISKDEYFGLPVITADGYEMMDPGNLYLDAGSAEFVKRRLKFIPYCGMENRGETNMTVWIPERRG